MPDYQLVAMGIIAAVFFGILLIGVGGTYLVRNIRATEQELQEQAARGETG